MDNLQPYLMMSLMMINIGTALVGVITGVRAAWQSHDRRRDSYHLVYLGVAVCITFVVIDLSWYYYGLSERINFWFELAIRGWQLLVVIYATLTLADQAKCYSQTVCPRFYGVDTSLVCRSMWPEATQMRGSKENPNDR